MKELHSHTLIIAEAGVNHDGCLDKAKELIDVADHAGADFVKFQTFNAKRLVASDLATAKYQALNTACDYSQYQMLRTLELAESSHKVLAEYCKSKKISFLSAGFDRQDLDLLVAMDVSVIKIPSGQITDLTYLRHAGSLGKPVFLSTGMATLGEIEAALEVLESVGSVRKNITLLQCTSEYPAPIEEVNLRAMCSMREAFGVDVGYSDHTLGFEASIAAVALGAKVVEKHFTLSRDLLGPDHKASLEPHELIEMIQQIRNVEQALGDGIKRPMPSEVKNIPVVRKSLVAAVPIRAGEVFTAQNLLAKRAGSGINPMRLDEVVGQVAQRSFRIDELITLH